jgi:hypothetical protein
MSIELLRTSIEPVTAYDVVNARIFTPPTAHPFAKPAAEQRETAEKITPVGC